MSLSRILDERNTPLILYTKDSRMQRILVSDVLEGLAGLGAAPPRFGQVVEIPIQDIRVDTNRFQGRKADFSQETFNKIVSEGFDKSREPIEVWKDPKNDKYYIISGHSRFAGAKHLYDQGDEELATIPAKPFLGNEQEAINYAILESNRSGTSEGIQSDISAYKRAITAGYNQDQLLAIFKTTGYINRLRDYAELDPNGRFIEYMGSDSENQFPYLARNAAWVGQLRRNYPAMTNAHEKEIFEYLYLGQDKSTATIRKERLFDIVEKKVARLDFEPSKPLNLQNTYTAPAYEQPAQDELNEIERKLEALRKEREQKEDQRAQARAKGNDKLAQDFTDRISQINGQVNRLLERRTQVQKNLVQLRQSMSIDLFSQQDIPAEPNRDEQELELKAKALSLKMKMRLRMKRAS